MLAAVCVLGLLAPGVRAEEMPGAYYDPTDDRLTHLELLELLCAGFPDPGYEHIPTPPQYIQQDYPNVRYGGYTGTVAKNGCGITTLAMFASYMMDEIHDPAEMAGYFQRYATPKGTEYRLFDDVAPFMGFEFIKRTSSWKTAAEALEAGHMVISLQTPGPFTSAAHFILLMHFNEAGKVEIRDANIVNHQSRFAKTDYFENGFPAEVITTADYLYWIYGKKVVNRNHCSRCADPEAGPVSPAVDGYYCSRCAAFLAKQGLYHSTMAQLRQKPEF